MEEIIASTANAPSIDAYYQEHGLNPLPAGGAKAARVKPPCDYCGLPGGNKKCTQCLSAYYCSRKCQEGDWKHGGHKALCKNFQEDCAATAERVVGEVGAAGLRPEARVASLGDLDRGGPYAAAVERGLHAALEGLLRDDASEVGLRFDPNGSGRSAISCAQFVSNVLLRGQRGVRVDGHEAAGFSKCDGARAAAFVASGPGCWPAWLAAAVAVGRAPLSPATRRAPVLHAAAHRAARDAWVGISLALARSEFARALLFVPAGAATHGAAATAPALAMEAAAEAAVPAAAGGATAEVAASSDVEAASAAVGSTAVVAAAATAAQAGAAAEALVAAQARARDFTAVLKAFLADLWRAPAGADVNSTIEANVFQVVGLMALWCEELGVWACAAEGLAAVGLSGGTKRAMYEGFTLPQATAMKAKGGMLTMDESEACLRAAAAASDAAKKGSKKSSKKGKVKR